jgi:hypothetical protein
MEGATAETGQAAISDGGAAMTKQDEMLALSERLLQLANDEGTAQIHDVAIKIAALVSHPAQGETIKRRQIAACLSHMKLETYQIHDDDPRETDDVGITIVGHNKTVDAIIGVPAQEPPTNPRSELIGWVLPGGRYSHQRRLDCM